MTSELILDIWDLKHSLFCRGCEMNDFLLVLPKSSEIAKGSDDSLVKKTQTPSNLQEHNIINNAKKIDLI